MKNGKTIFLFIIAFVIIGAIFIGEMNFQSMTTDSGFDVGYSGGGSSGGGSSGGGYSGSHSSSGGSGGSLIGSLAMLAIVFVVICIFSWINHCLEKIHIAKRVNFIFASIFLFCFITGFMSIWFFIAICIPNLLLKVFVVILVILAWIAFLVHIFKPLIKSFKVDIKNEKAEAKIDKIIKFAKKNQNNSEDNKKLLQKGYQIYLDVQKAWMNFNYESMRTLVTDELFNMYQTQLAPMELKGQQNIMESFKFQESYVASKQIENGITTVEMLLKVSFFDYIVNKNKKVIRGKKGRKVVMTYMLTFVLSDMAIEKCPHCGAKLEDGKTVCPYCKSVIQTTTTKMKLAKKEALKQDYEY